MNQERRRRARGQPLVVLMALLLGWTGARITSLGEGGGVSLPEVVLTVGTATAAQTARGAHSVAPGPLSYAGTGYPDVPEMAYHTPGWLSSQWLGAAGAPRGTLVDARTTRLDPRALLAEPSPDNERFFAGLPTDGVVPPVRNEDSLYAAALPALPSGSRRIPSSSRYGEVAALLGGRLGKLTLDRSRWSADAWTLMRDDGGVVLPNGALPATYGASQAGAVLRYRLSSRDPRRPTAYLRTTSTLGASTETSLAVGLSARPLTRVPIVGAVEGRLTDQAGSRRVQPAAMMVTELPALALPGRLQAEVYGQAGYVGGRYATPFADGQVRVDRRVFSAGRYEVRVGAGAWGGAQKGAARLDAGPAAVLTMPLAPQVFGRIGVDYRFRVAGDAEPGSGPALTVGAGF
ncbi:hypothetical protein [Novosphingobium sp. M1R2S20]|uniref:Bacterial surface antigen (D15) domain-containing protein n=1 Tax=Novosphingobium rhizovicinum TaxID=3228928 RepID=A0ABV3R8M2_9SPHN